MTLILQSLVEEWRQRIAALERLEATGQLEWLGEVQLKVLRYMWSRYAHDPRYQAVVGSGQSTAPANMFVPLDRRARARNSLELRRLLEDIHLTWLNSRNRC